MASVGWQWVFARCPLPLQTLGESPIFLSSEHLLVVRMEWWVPDSVHGEPETTFISIFKIVSGNTGLYSLKPWLLAQRASGPIPDTGRMLVWAQTLRKQYLGLIWLSYLEDCNSEHSSGPATEGYCRITPCPGPGTSCTARVWYQCTGGSCT